MNEHHKIAMTIATKPIEVWLGVTNEWSGKGICCTSGLNVYIVQYGTVQCTAVPHHRIPYEHMREQTMANRRQPEAIPLGKVCNANACICLFACLLGFSLFFLMYVCTSISYELHSICMSRAIILLDRMMYENNVQSKIIGWNFFNTSFLVAT